MFRRATGESITFTDDVTGEITVRRPYSTPGGGRLITKQSHKMECDMYSILNQFNRTGIITHINERKGQFVNLPDGLDFLQAQITLAEGREAFAALPAAVRDYFHNDPSAFLSAFADKDQHAKLREFGLMEPLKEPPAAPAAPPTGATPPAAS